ncbi:MAG: hypothetical protein ACAI43_09255 [Phycisphaerae bacterium]|nr:hypothetical protein [Tepidisphaeraceae bacterium]
MLRVLARGGVDVRAAGDELSVEGPPAFLSPSLLTELRRRKAEILAVLGRDFSLAAGHLLVRAALEGRLTPERFWEWNDWFVENVAQARADRGWIRTRAERRVYEQLADRLKDGGKGVD